MLKKGFFQAAVMVLLVHSGSVFLSAEATAGSVDFTPHGSQPRPLFDILEPLNCFDCHSNELLGAGAPGADFAPQNTWSGSLMANAARDPLFWAALDVANNDVPGIGDWCLRCHAPMGWYNGRVSKDGFGGDVMGEDGCQLLGTRTDMDSKVNDYAGVVCHVCHRIDEEGPSGEPFMIGNADIWLDDEDCAVGGTGPCRKGPYGYAAPDPEAPHPWEESQFFQESMVCGTCHHVSAPETSTGVLATLIDENGVDTGLPMPSDRTFTEWQLSDFSEVVFGDSIEQTPNLVTRTLHCQDCHMPNSNDVDAQACFGFPDFPPGGRTGDLQTHQFVGGNSWMTRVIGGQYGVGLDRVQEFANSAAWSDLMAQQAADLDIQSFNYNPGTGAGNLSVRVTNRTGHKLPTGYPEGRRIWVEVIIRDNNGVEVWRNGEFDPVTGDLAVDSQTKIYEAKPGQFNLLGTNDCDTVDAMGRPQFHLALNNCIAKDNRIPPKGFRGGQNPEVKPVGQVFGTVGGDPDRLVNFDVTGYNFAVDPSTPAPLELEVRLNFQTSSKEYIEFLRQEAIDNAFPSENNLCSRSTTIGPGDLSRGEYMYQLWNDPAYGKSPPVLMETAVSHSAVPVRSKVSSVRYLGLQ